MPIDPNTLHAERAAADADAAHALVARRWTELLGWVGDSPNVPEIAPIAAEWRDYDREWDGTKFSPLSFVPGVGPLRIYQHEAVKDRLAGEAAKLAVAEGNAVSHGYVVPAVSVEADGSVVRARPQAAEGKDSPQPPRSPAAAASSPGATVTRPTTPSVETLHPAATAIDKTAGEVEKKVKEKLPEPDPYLAVKVAGLAGLGLATMAGSLAAKREGVRVGIAAGGALLTIGAAFAAFWPQGDDAKGKKS